jgi:Predicted multitransmembrane protein
MKQFWRAPNLRQLRNRDNLFVLVIAILSIILFTIPTGFEKNFPQIERVRGMVMEVDDSGVQQFGIVKTGTQDLKVRILDGRFKGEEVDATNQLLGKMELDKFFAAGDTALIVLDVEGDEIKAATAFDHYRTRTEVCLFAIFALVLVIFARWIGVKALLSFVFTGLMLWKVMLPGFLKGWDPILLSFGVVTALAAVIIFLVGGLSKRDWWHFWVLYSAFYLPVLWLLSSVHPSTSTVLSSPSRKRCSTQVFPTLTLLASSWLESSLLRQVL